MIALGRRRRAQGRRCQRPPGSATTIAVELEPRQRRGLASARLGPVRAASASMSTGSWPSAASTVRASGSSSGASSRAPGPPVPAGPPPARRSSSRMSCAVSTSFAPFADQPVAALGERRVDRAGQREHLAPLLGGQARGDERARGQRRFDDQHAAREAADRCDCDAGSSAVSGGVPGANSVSSSPCPAIAWARSRLRRRIDAVGAGADRRRCVLAGAGERAAVRGRVDAGGEPADDGEARRRQRERERLGVGACPAGSRCGCRRWRSAGRPRSSRRPRQ